VTDRISTILEGFHGLPDLATLPPVESCPLTEALEKFRKVQAGIG
jgi:hypothetical protein